MDIEDRAEFRRRIEESRDRLSQTVSGLNEAQYNFKTAPDRWSIAECLEHIAITDEVLFRLITEKSIPIETPPENHDLEAAILRSGHVRKRRVPAPQGLWPTGRFATPEEALETFRRNCERTLTFVDGCDLDLRSRSTLHPVLGVITAQVCLALVLTHPARHTGQIEEIKDDPAFPK